VNGGWFAGAQPIVRLYLIEPTSIVVEALRKIFSIDRSLEIVGDAREIDVVEIGVLRPDLIVMDLDGLVPPIEVAIALCEEASPQSRVVVISMQLRARIMQRVLSARAAGYVVKDTTPSYFVEIIRSIAGGDFYADPRLAGALLRRRSKRPPVNNLLSTREVEIVRLIAEGLSNREIGSRVALSEKTIKNHVSHILSKLKISARTGVAVYAVRNGLVK